ncbi:MAG TPA: transcription antitermination factor NusB [Panacibacter sp.]|nr:transcription antitermination factor NusB [Panacibacter sp.]
MISRRNIRVKVMQELYAQQSGQGVAANPLKNLNNQLEQCRELFVYLLYFITEVARYSETDAKLRANRNLPSFEDRNVNTKMAGNETLWAIMENTSFKKELSRTLNFTDTAEWVKKIYNQLQVSDIYKKYILQNSREKKDDKELLVFIFTNLMLPSENFIEHLEEHFPNWDDDGEMMDQLMINYLQKPGTYNLQNLIDDEKAKFARDLFLTVTDKGAYAIELIKPKLKNWDSERIAVLDMILMQMGVCELLYFETIPPKVTINEYIDLAKEYSTPQSGQFVNGILDSIHKELVAENKIHKIDFRRKP